MTTVTKLAWFVVLLTVVGWTNPGVNAILDDYHCGSGTITKILSYGLSSFCNRKELNVCCKKHDDCYDTNCRFSNLVYQSCDSQMETCIDRSYGWFCRKFLGFTHMMPVRLFGGVSRLFDLHSKSETCRRKERLERKEKERLERFEQNRLERERQQMERERAELKRLELQRIEERRLERVERKRLQKLDRDRKEAERLEQLKQERRKEEQAERERLELERIQQIEAERQEHKRQELLEQDREEQSERDRLESKRREVERLEQLKREKQEIEEELLRGSGTDSYDDSTVDQSQEQPMSPTRDSDLDELREGSGSGTS